jgi:hypothetical protein
MIKKNGRNLASLAGSLLLALVASALLLGCNISDGPAPANPNFGGQWQATISVVSGSSQGNSFDVTVWLVQNGSEVTGTFDNGLGLAGSLEGDVGGNQLSFSMIQNPPCPGQFSGSVHIDGDILRGDYEGTACNGPVGAEFEATRS